MKPIFLITTLVWGVLCGSIQNLQAENAQHVRSLGLRKPPISYLFVISSKKSHIAKVSDHVYTLTLERGDLNNVLKFSDRPYRIAEYITPSDLADSWKTGENSFAKIHPMLHW